MQTPATDTADLRRRAEEELALAAPAAAAGNSETERLLQELRVHRIETELQNEELRQTRSAVEKLRDRYAEFYDFSPAGLLSLARSGAIIGANRACARLLGRARTRLLGSRFDFVLATAARPAFRAFLQQVFAGAAKQRCELQLAPRSGVPLSLRIEAVRSADQLECRAVLVDISEHRLLEEALRKSAELLRQTQSLARVGGWEYDVATGKVAWTEEVYRIYEVDADHDPNDIDQAVSFYAAEARAVIASAFRRAVELGETYELELPFVGARGTHKWVKTIGRAEWSAGSVRRVFGDIADITERKRAERALTEFNRDFETFLEHTNDFIYFKDSEGRFRFCSQALARSTGHDSWRDVIGKHGLEVFPADTARIYHEEEYPIFTEGKPLLNKINPYYDANGRAGYMQTTKLPVFDEEHKVVGIFGISSDITERKTRQELLERQVAERTAQLRAMSIELITTEERERQAIARDLHDGLCQTLAVAKLKLSALYRPHADSPWRAGLRPEVKAIEALLDQTNEAVRTLSLQLSPPALRRPDLLQALHALVDEMQNGYGLRVHIHDDGKPKQLDEALRFHVFRAARELLINVAKHAAVGDAELGVACSDGRLILSVSDAGAGFAALSDSAPSADGGYGLFSVRERIGFIGGDVHIDSHAGDGTVVVLSVPLVPAGANAAAV